MRTSTRILALVGLLAILAASTIAFGRSHAQTQIDISGDWNIELVGDLQLSCTAVITQLGAEFSMEVSCLSLGRGTFAGSVDTETGDFTASGALLGIDVALVGVASADGESIAGAWDSVIGFSGTFAGVRKGALETPTPLPTLASPVDISGTWRLTFSGLFSGACVSVIQQTDNELAIVADCDIIGSLRLSGSIDPTTGAFSLSGAGIGLAGLAAADGNSLSGTWDAFGLFLGTFTASRAEDVELIDLTGDWDVVLAGEVTDVCAWSIEQSLIESSATIDCGVLGLGTLTGTVNPLTGSLSLVGSLGDTQLGLEGRASADGGYILGRWFDSSERSGTFIAVPEGALAAGIMMVDCSAEQPGLQTRCSYQEGSELAVTVHVAVPPAGGYGGFQVELRWVDTILDYQQAEHPTAEELLIECQEAEYTLGEAAIRFRCLLSEPLGSEGSGDVIRLSMMCANSGEASVDLAPREGESQGSYFLGPEDELVDPTLIGATVDCFGPQHGGPTLPAGDVDCSGATTSIDAALVLQFEARLIDSLPCQQNADVNQDGRVNSVDGALILQCTAALTDVCR